MAMASPCPPAARLRQLLIGDLSSGEHADLLAHLDDCAACQRQLEAEAGGAELSDVARAVGSAPPSEEWSLAQLLSNLQSDASATRVCRAAPTAEWLKSLLRPAASLDLLGHLETYEVLEMVGHGGMGVVLKGFDPALRRPVAIKVLAPHLASDATARQRFGREARATAAVRHENVVTVHAVSEANGLPFLVMEYVDGGTLQDYLHLYGPLDGAATARVGWALASGLAAAHAQGLIHRDIKPSNILLHDPEPGTRNLERKTADDSAKPSATSRVSLVPFPVPKITDFGLARVADEVHLTQTGIVAGTPMYMSPEQAQAEAIDGRSDLFSLGSVLYVLCTGQEPFPAATPMGVLHRVCETEPQPIAQLNPSVPVWLIRVIERLHAKRPEDRFASASEVAELFRSYLAHLEEPGQVAEPRLTLLHAAVRKRRRRLTVAAILVLAGALLGSEWKGWTRWGEAVLPASWYDTTPVTLRATLRGHGGPVLSVGFSPDGQTVATGSDDGGIRLWNRQGRELVPLIGDGSSVYALRFIRAGNLLVSGDDDGKVKLWNVSNHRLAAQFRDKTSGVHSLAISPDSETIAVGSGDHEVELWNVATRKLLRTLPGHKSTVTSVAFSPDGQSLASGDTGGQIKLWNLADGTERVGFRADSVRIGALVFSLDSQTLASAGSGDKCIKLWRADTGELQFDFPGHPRGVICLAMDPHGRCIASGRRDGTIRFWNLATRQSLRTFPAHQGNVLSLAFSPDGQELASAGEDRLGKLWDIHAVQPPP